MFLPEKKTDKVSRKELGQNIVNGGRLSTNYALWLQSLNVPSIAVNSCSFFKPFKQVLLVRSIPTSKPVTSKLIHSQFHCKMAATQIRGASSLGFTVL